MELFCDGHQVAEVIGVRVSKKNCVNPMQFLEIFGAARIGHDPRVDERYLAGRSSERKSAVTEIGDAVGFQVEHQNALSNWSYPKRLKRMLTSNNTHKRLREGRAHFAES
jgi:hypothetical protein